jgi:hypothetical protein
MLAGVQRQRKYHLHALSTLLSLSSSRALAVTDAPHCTDNQAQTGTAHCIRTRYLHASILISLKAESSAYKKLTVLRAEVRRRAHFERRRAGRVAARNKLMED